MRGCCGGSRRRRSAAAAAPAAEPLPANPAVGKGVVLVYIGAGPKAFRGAGDRTYHVGSSRRRVKVAHDDVVALVASGDFVELP